MRKVTRLVTQQKNTNRVNVYLDGEFAFGLAIDEAVRLRIGQELSDEEIAGLQQEDGYHKARDRALNLIARRPRSRGEIERYLAGKSFEPALIERVVTRLEETGLLDDLDFAIFWIENRENFRPRGARAIRYELRQKGVDATIIDQALERVAPDEEASAYRAATKVARRWGDIEEPYEFQQKVASYLARRGFGWDAIRATSDRLWAERDGARDNP